MNATAIKRYFLGVARNDRERLWLLRDDEDILVTDGFAAVRVTEQDPLFMDTPRKLFVLPQPGAPFASAPNGEETPMKRDMLLTLFAPLPEEERVPLSLTGVGLLRDDHTIAVLAAEDGQLAYVNTKYMDFLSPYGDWKHLRYDGLWQARDNKRIQAVWNGVVWTVLMPMQLADDPLTDLMRRMDGAPMVVQP